MIDPSNRGLTLIEMLVVISLIAILGALATPSLTGLLNRSRIAGEINRLVGDLQFARSEAIKRGQPVTVCASSDGTTCDTTLWHSGWIVFSDPVASAAVPDPEAVLRVRRAWESSDTFVATPAVAAFTYGRDGFSMGLPAASVMLQLRATPPDNFSTRCVSINRVGRQTVKAAGVGGCA